MLLGADGGVLAAALDTASTQLLAMPRMGCLESRLEIAELAAPAPRRAAAAILRELSKLAALGHAHLFNHSERLSAARRFCES